MNKWLFLLILIPGTTYSMEQLPEDIKSKEIMVEQMLGSATKKEKRLRGRLERSSECTDLMRLFREAPKRSALEAEAERERQQED